VINAYLAQGSLQVETARPRVRLAGHTERTTPCWKPDVRRDDREAARLEGRLTWKRWRSGWDYIDVAQLAALAEPMRKNG